MYKHIILSTMHFHYFANVNRMNTGIKNLIVHNVQITVKIDRAIFTKHLDSPQSLWHYLWFSISSVQYTQLQLKYFLFL